MDLARAKSEALDNFDSFLKQNIKSYNAKRRRQRERLKKTPIGLISKQATLHAQHTFFVHFFAVVLHDCNVKRPETSWLHVLSVVRVLAHFFFSLSLIFTLVAASLPPQQNFTLFLQQKMSPFVSCLSL